MSKKHWINMGTVASVTEDKLDKSRIHAISCDSNEMHSSENSQHRFTCYQQRKSDSSLLKAFLSWFSNSIVLMILFIPFMCIISILSLVLLPVSFRLFGVYVVFIWAVTVLPIFYMLNALNIAHYDVAIFYSIFPAVILVVFRESFVVALHIRERIRSLDHPEYKSLYGKCSLLFVKRMKLFHLLSAFATKYKIWGITLQHYKPFSELLCYYPRHKTQSMCQIMSHCISQFNLDSGWSFVKAFKIYTLSDRIMCIAMLICGIMFLLLPPVILIHQTTPNVPFVCFMIVGSVINIVIVYAIYVTYELIFYRVFKYYAYMERLADILDIDHDVDPIANTDDHRLIPCDNEYKQQMSKVMVINSRDEIVPAGDEYYLVSDVEQPVKLYLYEGQNCEIWFENWARIESLGSIYFENRKSNVFAVVTFIAIALIYSVYSLFFHASGLSANMFAIYVGLLCAVVAFVRLLSFALRFSHLQDRHIGLLHNQRLFALHKMKQRKQFSHGDSLIIIEYIKAIIDQIECRSVSPKISNVSLNVALVRLTATTIIGFLTSTITYVIKRYF
eukprot:13646_1